MKSLVFWVLFEFCWLWVVYHPGHRFPVLRGPLRRLFDWSRGKMTDPAVLTKRLAEAEAILREIDETITYVDEQDALTSPYGLPMKLAIKIKKFLKSEAGENG